MKKILSLILILILSTYLIAATTTFLIIGDSVGKIGQFDFFTSLFSVYQPSWSMTVVADKTRNDGGAIDILTNYTSYIGSKTFDYLILNYGLHDLGTSWADYKSLSCQIADSLKKQNRKLIYCYTTRVLDTGLYLTHNRHYFDSIVPGLNVIAKHVFDSIMGADVKYIDQYSMSMNCPVFIYDGPLHPNAPSYQMLAYNTFDSLIKWYATTSVSDPEWSSYGIDAPDSNLTGMAEYSSYGIDARGFNNYWRGGSGYADSIIKWSNAVVPDSLDLAIALNGDNEIIFTSGTTYLVRGLSLSGTSGHPDTLRSGTPGSAATLNLGGATVTAPYLYAKDITVINGVIIATTGGINGGNTSGIQWPATTSKRVRRQNNMSAGVDLRQ
jgi:hypothetical protein